MTYTFDRRSCTRDYQGNVISQTRPERHHLTEDEVLAAIEEMMSSQYPCQVERSDSGIERISFQYCGARSGDTISVTYQTVH